MKVKIELVVDIRDLEFHGLEIGSYVNKSEAWGQVRNETIKYAEWDRVTWNGEEVCLIDDADAENYLIDDGYYGYDE